MEKNELLKQFIKDRQGYMNEYISNIENQSSILKIRSDVHILKNKISDFYNKKFNQYSEELLLLQLNLDFYNNNALFNFTTFLDEVSTEWKLKFGDYYYINLIRKIDGNLSFCEFVDSINSLLVTSQDE